MKIVSLVRRISLSLLLCALLFPLFSCGEAAEPAALPDASAPGAAVGTDAGSGIDLTVMSSTMVYAEVYNMVTVPEEYLGRYVRMRGAFSAYTDPETRKTYFACIIADATACCSQGIEFELKNAAELTYPGDYPEEGQEITVSGTFNTYMEGSYLYCELADAVLE